MPVFSEGCLIWPSWLCLHTYVGSTSLKIQPVENMDLTACWYGLSLTCMTSTDTVPYLRFTLLNAPTRLMTEITSGSKCCVYAGAIGQFIQTTNHVLVWKWPKEMAVILTMAGIRASLWECGAWAWDYGSPFYSVITHIKLHWFMCVMWIFCMAVASGPAGSVLARPVYTVKFGTAHAQIMNTSLGPLLHAHALSYGW